MTSWKCLIDLPPSAECSGLALYLYIKLVLAINNKAEERMTKAEFVARIAEKTGSTKADAEKGVNAFLEAITETLRTGDKVSFAGFGSFEVTERAAREGRNPQTGETMQIPAGKIPKFKAGKALKAAVA